MTFDSRALLLVALFCCLANALFGQQDDSDYVHTFQWKKDNYALRYEVFIEREEDGKYENIWQESTEDTFIVFLPPPGNYRWQVIQYDIFGHPGKGSAWKYFTVLAAPLPEKPPPDEPQPVVVEAPFPELEEEDSAPPEPAVGRVRAGAASTPRPKNHYDFYLAFLGESIGYSRSGAAFGGGVALGGSFSGMGLGMTLLYTKDAENILSLEALIHFRLYLSRVKDNTGLFLQAEGGAALFSYEQFEITDYYALSAGLAAGWRFPLTAGLYIEPVIRAGYPYILGGGVSLGFRFDNEGLSNTVNLKEKGQRSARINTN